MFSQFRKHEFSHKNVQRGRKKWDFAIQPRLTRIPSTLCTCLIFSPPCVFLYKAIDVAHTQTTLNQLFYRTIGLRTTFSYFVGGNLGLLTGEWGWHTLEDQLIPLPVAHWHDVLPVNLIVDSAEMQGMWQEGVDNHRCGVEILVCTGDEHILGCRTIIFPIFPTSFKLSWER